VGGLAPVAWRSLAARPVRTALTIVGIALGVAVLAAALATSEGIDAAIDQTVADVAGRADLILTAFDESGLSDDSVAAVSELDDVDVAAPSIERRTYAVAPISADPGETAWTDAPVAVLGIDPILDPGVRDLAVIRGSALSRPDEPSALISETLAAASGLDIGSELELFGAAAAPPEAGRFRIIGIVRGDGPIVGAAGRVVIVPLERAKALFAMTGVTRLDVVLQPGAGSAAVADALPAAIGEPYVLSTPADLAASLQASTREFRATMALVAAVALFAGAFLIFNTLSMTVTERVRDVALLRAAGATSGQVSAVVLGEALVIGLAGAALGLGLGLGLAVVLGGFVRGAFGFRAILDPSIGGLLLVAVIGLAVTLAAALEPARRAGSISPVAALRARAEPGIEGRARLRWLAVVAAVVAVAGILLWPGGAAGLDVTRPLAVYGLLLAVALVSPFVLPVLGRVAGLPFSVVVGVEERLARGALARDRSRTALTVGALTIGLALVVAIGTVALDARRSASLWIEDVIPGDELLTAVTPVATGSEGPIGSFESIDGVDSVTPLATFPVAFRGVRLDATAVSGADFEADGRLTFVDGDRGAAFRAIDVGGAVLVPEAHASRLDLELGDTMELATGTDASVPLSIVGIIERGLPGRGGESILVGWSDASGTLGVAGADALAVRYAAVADRESSSAAVAELARSLALQPVPIERVEGAVSDALGRVFGLFDLLALVAVVVAALGIVNTLAMDVAERVREIGILRATGMTRRQVGRMVVVEAGVLGLSGAILGVVTGLGAAMLLLSFAGARDLGGLAVPWPTIGLAFLLGVGLAMLAAYYPARLASRLSIVRAVRAE
jgi:putative ABC transport system permease protein